ncbi:UNVERIFIED_CONTAM: hypothetical protein K2H54_000856 [Gekko kuhli]
MVLVVDIEEAEDLESTEIVNLTWEQFKKLLIGEVQQAVEAACKNLFEKPQSLLLDSENKNEPTQPQQSSDEEQNYYQGKVLHDTPPLLMENEGSDINQICSLKEPTSYLLELEMGLVVDQEEFTILIFFML